jgi:hypothetical protein
MENSNHSVSNLHVRYKQFQKDQRDIWQSFCIIDFYGPKIRDLVKADRLPPLEIDRVWNETSRSLDKKSTFGAIDSLTVKGNYRRTLLETVLLFEDFMSDLISAVYLDYPKKLLSESNDNDAENKSSYQKLVRLILESNDHSEIIDKLVEEKIRGIFYGNPIDVFLKDKAKMEFGTYFKDTHSSEINKFKKIVAIRNLIAHNNGRVDRKYVREADGKAVLGRMIEIDRQFLKDSIFVLSLLAAHATRLVVEKIYKEKPGGRLGSAIQQFAKYVPTGTEATAYPKTIIAKAPKAIKALKLKASDLSISDPKSKDDAFKEKLEVDE